MPLWAPKATTMVNVSLMGVDDCGRLVSAAPTLARADAMVQAPAPEPSGSRQHTDLRLACCCPNPIPVMCRIEQNRLIDCPAGRIAIQVQYLHTYGVQLHADAGYTHIVHGVCITCAGGPWLSVAVRRHRERVDYTTNWQMFATVVPGCQLPTANCQLPTANCQLPTICRATCEDAFMKPAVGALGVLAAPAYSRATGEASPAIGIRNPLSTRLTQQTRDVPYLAFSTRHGRGCHVPTLTCRRLARRHGKLPRLYACSREPFPALRFKSATTP
ncbi:hypothetical protein GMOD_00002693 [Pyrenophora seminiperda CCB06]|uniref:Uncharacterized protein n=1 Tax=Pyrenophora seminiperda CCB06 TaxID=1302712 RepID=A0A3M7M2S4_9PLEO|nr:hypothetical protein GMOD_00002693 [Pyrenophora seminiperda CCB06]